MENLARGIVRLLAEKNPHLNDPLVAHAVDFVISKNFKSTHDAARFLENPQQGLRKIANSIVEYSIDYMGMEDATVRGTDGETPWFFPEMEPDIEYLVMNFIRETEKNPLLKLAVCKEKVKDFLALHEVLEAHTHIFDRFFRITEDLVRNGCPESTDMLSIILKDRSFAQIMKFLKELEELEQEFWEDAQENRPESLLTAGKKKKQKDVQNERKKNWEKFREARERERQEELEKAKAATAPEQEKDTRSNPIYDFLKRVTLRDLAITVIQVLEVASQLSPKPNPKFDTWSNVIVMGTKGDTTHKFKKRKYHLSDRPWEETYEPELFNGETEELQSPGEAIYDRAIFARNIAGVRFPLKPGTSAWEASYGPGSNTTDIASLGPDNQGREVSNGPGTNALYAAGSIGTIGLHFAFRPSHPEERAALVSLLAMGGLPEAEAFEPIIFLSAVVTGLYADLGATITAGIVSTVLGAVGYTTYTIVSSVEEEAARQRAILLDQNTQDFIDAVRALNEKTVLALPDAVQRNLVDGVENFRLVKESVYNLTEAIDTSVIQARFLSTDPNLPHGVTLPEQSAFWKSVMNAFRPLTGFPNQFVTTLVCPPTNGRCITADIMSTYLMDGVYEILNPNSQPEIRYTLANLTEAAARASPSWVQLESSQGSKTLTKYVKDAAHTPYTETIRKLSLPSKVVDTTISILQLMATTNQFLETIEELPKGPKEIFKDLGAVITSVKSPFAYFTTKFIKDFANFDATIYVKDEASSSTIAQWMAGANLVIYNFTNAYTLETMKNWESSNFEKSPVLKATLLAPETNYAAARLILEMSHNFTDIFTNPKNPVTEAFSIVNATKYLRKRLWGKEVFLNKDSFIYPRHFVNETTAALFNGSDMKYFWNNTKKNEDESKRFAVDYTAADRKFREQKGKLMNFDTTILSLDDRQELAVLKGVNVTVVEWNNTLSRLANVNSIQEYLNLVETALRSTLSGDKRFSNVQKETIDDLTLLWNTTEAQNIISANSRSYPLLYKIRATGNETLANCQKLITDTKFLGVESISGILKKAKEGPLNCPGIFQTYIAIHEETILEHFEVEAVKKLQTYKYQETQPEKPGFLGEREFLPYLGANKPFRDKNGALKKFMDSRVLAAGVCTKEIRGVGDWLKSFTQHLFSIPTFEGYIKANNDKVANLDPQEPLIDFMKKNKPMVKEGLEVRDFEYVLEKRNRMSRNFLRKVKIAQQTSGEYEYFTSLEFTSPKSKHLRDSLQERLTRESITLILLQDKNTPIAKLFPGIVDNIDFGLVGEELGRELFNTFSKNDYHKMEYKTIKSAQKTMNDMQTGANTFFKEWLNSEVPESFQNKQRLFVKSQEALGKMVKIVTEPEENLLNFGFDHWAVENGGSYYDNIREYKSYRLDRMLYLLGKVFDEQVSRLNEKVTSFSDAFNHDGDNKNGAKDWSTFLGQQTPDEALISTIRTGLRELHEDFSGPKILDEVYYLTKAEKVKASLRKMQEIPEGSRFSNQFARLQKRIILPHEFLPEIARVASEDSLSVNPVFSTRDFFGEYVADSKGAISASTFVKPNAITVFLPRYRFLHLSSQKDLEEWANLLPSGAGFISVNGSDVTIVKSRPLMSFTSNPDVVLKYERQSSNIYPTPEKFIDSVIGIIEKEAMEMKEIIIRKKANDKVPDKRFQGFRMIEVSDGEALRAWNTTSIEEMLWVELQASLADDPFRNPSIEKGNNFRALLHENHGIWRDGDRKLGNDLDGVRLKLINPVILAQEREKFKEASKLNTLTNDTYVDLVTSLAISTANFDNTTDYDRNALIALQASLIATFVAQQKTRGMNDTRIMDTIVQKAVLLSKTLKPSLKNEKSEESRVEKTFRLMGIVDSTYRDVTSNEGEIPGSKTVAWLVLATLTTLLKIIFRKKNLKRRGIVLTRELEHQLRIKDERTSSIGRLGAIIKKTAGSVAQEWDTILTNLICGLASAPTFYGYKINPVRIVGQAIATRTIPYTLQTFTSHSAMALRLVRYTQMAAQGTVNAINPRIDENGVRIIRSELPAYLSPANGEQTECFISNVQLLGATTHSEDFRREALLSIRFALAEFCDDLDYYTWLMKLPLIPGALIPKHGFRQIDPTNFMITALNFMNPNLQDRALKKHCEVFVRRVSRSEQTDTYSLFVSALHQVCYWSEAAAQCTQIYTNTNQGHDPQLFTKILIRTIPDTGAFQRGGSLETLKESMKKAIEDDKMGFKDKIAMTRCLSTFMKIAHKETVQNMKVLTSKVNLTRTKTVHAWETPSAFSSVPEKLFDQETQTRKEIEKLTLRNLLTARGDAMDFHNYFMNNTMPPESNEPDGYSFYGPLDAILPTGAHDMRRIIYLACVSASIGMSLLHYWNNKEEAEQENGLDIMKQIERQKYQRQYTPVDQAAFRAWFAKIPGKELDFWNFKLPWIHLHTYGTLGLHILSELQTWTSEEEYTLATKTTFVQKDQLSPDADLTGELFRTKQSLFRRGINPSFLDREEHVLKCRPSHKHNREPGIRLRKFYAALQIMKNIDASPSQSNNDFWTRWGIHIERNTIVTYQLKNLVNNLDKAEKGLQQQPGI